jgi:hypothetical protein
MNCIQVREQLAALLYGDLSPEQARRVEEHLASCAECRRERLALQQLRHLLDAASVPGGRTLPGAIDLPRLYRQAAERQEQRLRRWRRAAYMLAGAAAAVLILALLPRWELRLEAQQLTIRWGNPSSLDASRTTPLPRSTAPGDSSPVVGSPAPSPEFEARLRVVEELIQLVSADLDQRDSRRQKELARLRARFDSLQQQDAQWRQTTQDDFTTLYNAAFRQSKKGTIP